MTLKPPTKTFPKLVMREWPGRDNTEFYCPRFGAPYFGRVETDGLVHWYETKQDDGSIVASPLLLRSKALSDFTRVVEETGVLDQQRPQKEKSRDE